MKALARDADEGQSRAEVPPADRRALLRPQAGAGREQVEQKGRGFEEHERHEDGKNRERRPRLLR